MPAPKTLLELATQQRDAAKAAAVQAQQELAKARDAAAKSRQAQAAAAAVLAQLEKDTAAIREALAKAPTRADAEALARQLEQKTIDLRAAQGKALELERTVALKQDGEARQGEDWKAAAERLAAAEAALAQAANRNKQRAKLDEALGKPPLATLRVDATTALANKPFTDAETRVAGDLPAALLTRARERRAAFDARLARLQASVTVSDDLSVAAAARRFRRAEAAFSDYVLLGKERFDRAKALLAAVADGKNSPLTAEQKARITDAALVASGTAAAAKQKDRDNAQNALDEKQAALDDAILKVVQADPDADPANDAAVKAATTDRDKAQTDLNTADGAFTAAMKKDLDTWEAAVPDTTWRLVDDFEEAKALLTLLRDTDPAALTTEINTAETEWVKALLAAEKKERAARLVAVAYGQRAAAAAREQAAASHLKFAALRGDY
jgi:hypothetical protein